MPTVDIGKNLYTYPEPKAPKLPEDRYETVSSNIVGSRGGKVNLIRDKHTNKEFEVPVYIKPEKVSKDKVSYYDLTKSGDAFREYKNLQSGIPVQDPDDSNKFGGFKVTMGNKLVTLSQSEIEELKRQKIREIEDATNNESRRINSKVPGFHTTFQALFKVIKSPDEIDNVVNKNLKGVSSETRDAMKTLLKRRIFK